MIFGVGTDIVSIGRVKTLCGKFRNRFPEKILNAAELAEFNKLENDYRISFLAKRFAAKEAVSKALGCGIGEKLSFHDITVRNSFLGKPEVSVANHKKFKFHLSLSDEKDGFAIAFVIAES